MTTVRSIEINNLASETSSPSGGLDVKTSGWQRRVPKLARVFDKLVGLRATWGVNSENNGFGMTGACSSAHSFGNGLGIGLSNGPCRSWHPGQTLD